MAAAPDCHSYWNSNGTIIKNIEKIKVLKPNPDLFFNSGVMLMDLDGIRDLNRHENIFIKQILCSLRAGLDIDYQVQDTLNQIFSRMPDKLLLLDNSFIF